MEKRKFLDLDHICDQIPNEDDRKMFNEAIRCYQIRSHRATVILAWCVTADCLYRRIIELADENDGTAQQAVTELEKVRGKGYFEENLIAEAKKCELFDDYEEKCLRFARDTRSKCAHPTGIVPSAESVRHIIHICSQVVLCRNGFRGMSFIKQFIEIKLDDRHLFNENNHVKDVAEYYIGKVANRIIPQFAATITSCYGGRSSYWNRNALIFIEQLYQQVSDDTAQKIAGKLSGIEEKDRLFFSTIVGLSQKENVWDEHQRNQAKAHLRDALVLGKIDNFQLSSFCNLCALSTLEEDDKSLIKSRFAFFSKHLSKQTLLQKKHASSLIEIVLDGLDDDETIKEQILKGLDTFSTLEDVFTNDTTEQNEMFIDTLIKADWQNEHISRVWIATPSWPSPLQAAMLKKTEAYLFECSEDKPDELLVIFETVESLISRVPSLLPAEFEVVIKNLIESDIKPSWYDDTGEAFQTFIGQVKLLQTRHSTNLAQIAALTLPALEYEDED